MQLRELMDLVESTSDAAFAVDGSGLIVAWNAPAEVMFGVPVSEAIGKPCGQIVQGSDECGVVCSRDCTVQQAVRSHHPVGNFDLQMETKSGVQWSNISVLAAHVASSSVPYSIHIIRPIDARKRLELAVRDFIVNKTGLPADQAKTLMSSAASPAREVDLSKRELEILSLLAKGATTARIASQLHISRTTVNNHVQHILRKFNVHTRLEAIRRAEVAGLIK